MTTSSSKQWPCWFTRSDTTGEKAFGEFSHPDEQLDLGRFKQAGVVTKPRFDGADVVSRRATEMIDELSKSNRWEKNGLLEALQLAVPELEHTEHERNLDQKM